MNYIQNCIIWPHVLTYYHPVYPIGLFPPATTQVARACFGKNASSYKPNYSLSLVRAKQSSRAKHEHLIFHLPEATKAIRPFRKVYRAGWAPFAMGLSFQHPFQENQFEIFEWYPKYQSCVEHFVNHAQYTGPIQAVAAFVNIKLPYQKAAEHNSSGEQAAALPHNLVSSLSRQEQTLAAPNNILLTPYVRRLVATAFNSPTVLHGFFGDDWQQGIGPLHEAERRNYLFAAKSDTWLSVKSQYDMGDGQSVPFLRPLQNLTVAEIESVEANWSEWLAMQDWMLGPRAPIPDGSG